MTITCPVTLSVPQNATREWPTLALSGGVRRAPRPGPRDIRCQTRSPAASGADATAVHRSSHAARSQPRGIVTEVLRTLAEPVDRQAPPGTAPLAAFWVGWAADRVILK